MPIKPDCPWAGDGIANIAVEMSASMLNCSGMYMVSGHYEA